jgi:hypothetical protein
VLTALILVCSMALAPEARLCDRQNAVSVLQLPQQEAHPVTCFLHGQAYLAGTSLKIGEGEYPKVLCIRTGRPGRVG